MKKIAFILTIISMVLFFLATAFDSFSQWRLAILIGVYSNWVVFACFYGVHIWRQSKREAQAIEEKYDAKMKRLIVESSLREQQVRD